MYYLDERWCFGRTCTTQSPCLNMLPSRMLRIERITGGES